MLITDKHERRTSRLGRTAWSLVTRGLPLGGMAVTLKQIAHLNRLVGQQRNRRFS